MSAPSRPTLRLTLTCDNTCVFCCQDGLTGHATDLSERIAAFCAEGHDEVTLVGGEPLLADAIVETVATLRGRGLEKIGLQTNGGRLGSADGLVDRLRSAGLTDVHLSIHGARPEVHDHHTAQKGSLARVVSAMARLRAARVPFVVTTVLTRSNQAVVGELPARLSSWGAAAWQIALPHARGRAERAAPRILPRLALALPRALHAMARAEKASLPAFIRGAPHCLLGPFVSRALPSPPRSYASACHGCPARDACPGMDALYLERFGGDELSPKTARGPAPAGSPISRLFVGPGELAPNRADEARPHSLPVVR